MPWDMLSLGPVTSPPRKKSRHHFKVLIVESKDEEKKTHSEEMGGGNDEEFQAKTTQANSKEELNVNFHYIIEDVQVELVEPLVTIVKVRELVIVFVGMYQLVQLVNEHVNIKDP
jgi:hypothetical protein